MARPALPLLLLGLALAGAAAPALAEPPRRPTAAQLEAIRRWLCPNGGAPVKGAPGRCDRGVDRTPWDRDLAPAARNATTACPEGTRPVLARGHRDIIRCLPV
ncbi:hypothetical protein [Pseudoroseomonas cervicalis]|uniref:hypothetical protein n=1 Tax=Teichococcus cervicalis TaxID=204525 RepID=UPI0022F199D7|nr:hypothetical protein [Pseudoroseomonas cervicalis]WBV41447.1 hypothetical protein PFY06_09285 [Pseudoroseomonas cervicalis]